MFIGTNLDMSQSRSSFQSHFISRLPPCILPTHPNPLPFLEGGAQLGISEKMFYWEPKSEDSSYPMEAEKEDSRVGSTFIFLIEKDMGEN